MHAKSPLSYKQTIKMMHYNVTETLELIKKGIIVCRTKHRSHPPFGIFYGHNPLDYGFPLMLVELSLFMIITSCLRILLEPFRQPKVVSSILGGIILGPSVLCRNEKFRTYVFTDNANYVIRNIGLLGFCWFLFLNGVKMDVAIVRKAEKKQWYIGLIGVLVPLCCSVSLAFAVRKSFSKEMSKLSSMWGITVSLAITSFPVLYPIIRELNLLSSDIGRMALSTSLVSEVIGLNGVVIFEALKQGEMKPMAALWFFISFLVVFASAMGGLRPACMWISRTTPEGKEVDQIYVVGILLGVLVSAFITDFLGLAIANGAFWIGLAVPDGPPLGASLVEKSETIIENFFMPFSFLVIGMLVDVSLISVNWSNLKPLLLIVLVTYTVKLLSTLIAALMFDMSIRDSLALSLIMSLRGEIELLLFLHWMDFKMVGPPQITILVLATVCTTAIATPLISLLYDPTQPYMVNKRRNIQHRPPNARLHIVVCIPGEESLSGLMKLLKVSNPTASSPFSVYALRLIELVGRASPVFIDHEDENQVSDLANYGCLHKAWQIFEENIGEYIRINLYTAITLKRNMYQEICELSLNKKACLIILPHHKKSLNNIDEEEGMKQGFQLIISNVLMHAPCSVGVLVDKSRYENISANVLRNSKHHFAVLFMGGADAREALTYADLMAASTDVSLTVIRFLSHDSKGDNQMEKKLDDGLVMSFWVKNEANQRIVYKEVVVKNGEETVAAIRSMNEDYDLWIMGRKNGINPVLLNGLSKWEENNELGVIGEYVTSVDFGSGASVLVVQQQILRGQETTRCSLLRNCAYKVKDLYRRIISSEKKLCSCL